MDFLTWSSSGPCKFGSYFGSNQYRCFGILWNGGFKSKASCSNHGWSWLPMSKWMFSLFSESNSLFSKWYSSLIIGDWGSDSSTLIDAGWGGGIWVKGWMILKNASSTRSSNECSKT